ncbi:hypothetical protein FD12_GL001575 [Lentilactobacillus rapi DSM 19907 = JCM 15042]|uniref:Uncharacterized protein n=4 Tax=Lactobacillaceae TaxID=33958 RepID=A0A0R2FFQ2_9LACO|nr:MULTISPECIES: hypothetical protein [Lactobacillaceae]KRL17648.1 hypothetical protein FD12_GL001575 [Lentilactobacillus rapi DSM 19907 = JCM 15042]KRN27368.1 hypothetical protein IV38_GL002211 [Lactobacillus selangorensis]GEP71996.1 hypothetical protein LRA02_08640 [Lentilactobacillus rapi]
MTKIAWANEMQKLAKEQPHPDWLLTRYQDQMRAVVRNGGTQYGPECEEIFRLFAMMTMLSQYDEGLIKNIIWNPELSAQDYLDYDHAIEMQKKKEDEKDGLQSH